MKPDTVLWQPPLPVEEEPPPVAAGSEVEPPDDLYRRAYDEGRAAAARELAAALAERLAALEREARTRMEALDRRLEASAVATGRQLVELALGVVEAVLGEARVDPEALVRRVQDALAAHPEVAFRRLSVCPAAVQALEAAVAPLGLEVRADAELSALSFYLEGPELSLDGTIATALKEIELALREALGGEDAPWNGAA